MTIRVRLDELMPSKDVSRGLPKVLDRIEAQEVEHVVITRRSAPSAVLVGVERYEHLVRAASERQLVTT